MVPLPASELPFVKRTQDALFFDDRFFSALVPAAVCTHSKHYPEASQRNSDQANTVHDSLAVPWEAFLVVFLKHPQAYKRKQKNQKIH